MTTRGSVGRPSHDFGRFTGACAIRTFGVNTLLA